MTLQVKEVQPDINSMVSLTFLLLKHCECLMSVFTKDMRITVYYQLKHIVFDFIMTEDD